MRTLSQNDAVNFGIDLGTMMTLKIIDELGMDPEVVSRMARLYVDDIAKKTEMPQEDIDLMIDPIIKHIREKFQEAQNEADV